MRQEELFKKSLRELIVFALNHDLVNEIVQDADGVLIDFDSERVTLPPNQARTFLRALVNAYLADRSGRPPGDRVLDA